MISPIDRDVTLVGGVEVGGVEKSGVEKSGVEKSGVEPAVVVWLISEGHPGHYNQSWGWCRALSDLTPVRVCWRTAAISGRGVLRRWRLRNLGAAAGEGLRSRLVDAGWSLDEPAERPHIIVASGDRAAAPCLSLARRTGAKSAFIGRMAPSRERLFDRVFSTDPRSRGSNVVRLNTMPTPVRKSDADAAQTANEAAFGAPLAALLIGAATRGAPFTTRDWTALADLVNTPGRRWLISTSRRTGAKTEAHLRRLILPAAVAEAVWYSRAPRSVIPRFFGAPLICVTGDSLSMSSEAFASGRQVVLINPKAAGLDAAVTRLQQTLCESPRVSAFRLQSAHSLPPPVSTFDAEDLPEEELRRAIAGSGLLD